MERIVLNKNLLTINDDELKALYIQFEDLFDLADRGSQDGMYNEYFIHKKFPKVLELYRLIRRL